ncbi:hypothetical protein EBT16_04220 [bacterium]|nr:hypothetical protein [bacterium]
MTFKQYLKETPGTFAIVSCKDRKNSNFQVWGAMSDLKCRSGRDSIPKMKFNGDKENSNGKARKKQ